MNKKLRNKAVQLRLEEELSYSEIKKRLGVPKSTLSYWLRDYPLSEERILELRRKGWRKGEASRERYRNTMRKKQEEKFNKVYEQQKDTFSKISKKNLYIAGLMLYLGEGKKKDRYTISIANTDYRILKFFIKWTEQYFHVPKSKLKAQLHLYEDMELEKEKKFWENKLDLKKDQFYKTQVRKLQEGSFTYRESYRHGTCQISFSSAEKKRELMASIKAFVDLHFENR